MMLVFSTFPTEDSAREIVRKLVEERLIACGSLVPIVHSIYRWREAVHDEPEVLAILKLSRAAYPDVQRRLCELHPNELPEIVGIPIDAALPEYLAWVAENSQRSV
jgi:periplasmic divalent cation tolerance protein